VAELIWTVTLSTTSDLPNEPNSFKVVPGPDLQTVVSATYELHMASGTYDKRMISAIYKESCDILMTMVVW